jgi:hypothetical protein
MVGKVVGLGARARAPSLPIADIPHRARVIE